MAPIVINRSIRLWVLAPFAYAWAIFEIYPVSTGIAAGSFHQYGKGLSGPAMFGIFASLGVTAMMVVDTYTRFIKKNCVEISSDCIIESISKYKVGKISWTDIHEISISRGWFGSTLRITFKNRVASPDLNKTLEIPQLEISEEEEVQIRTLAAASKPA